MAFKQGAMQDVRLVAGSNGHLAQCPTAEAECPTCGEFHSLQSVVARLERTLQQLTNKVQLELASALRFDFQVLYIYPYPVGGCGRKDIPVGAVRLPAILQRQRDGPR